MSRTRPRRPPPAVPIYSQDGLDNLDDDTLRLMLWDRVNAYRIQRGDEPFPPLFTLLATSRSDQS